MKIKDTFTQRVLYSKVPHKQLNKRKLLLLKGMQRKGGWNCLESDLESVSLLFKRQTGNRVSPNTVWVVCLNQRTWNWAWELSHFVLQSDYKQKSFYYLLNNFPFQIPFVNQVGHTEHTQSFVGKTKNKKLPYVAMISIQSNIHYLFF